MPENNEDESGLYFTPDTHKKVYAGLLEAGIYGQNAVDVVNAIEKQGVFFREKKPKRRGRPRLTPVEPSPGPELAEATEKTGDLWGPQDA